MDPIGLFIMGVTLLLLLTAVILPRLEERRKRNR